MPQNDLTGEQQHYVETNMRRRRRTMLLHQQFLGQAAMARQRCVVLEHKLQRHRKDCLEMSLLATVMLTTMMWKPAARWRQRPVSLLQ